MIRTRARQHTARLLPLFLLTLAGCPAGAAPQEQLEKSKGEAAKSAPAAEQWVRRTDPAMERWRDHRFGQFVHWGIYAVPGGFWNGKRIDYAAEWIKVAGKVPTREYEALAHAFNPIHYDPQAWARQFKAGGAKYVVITTKHHDGFCLWNSKQTHYDMEATPYKKDLLKPLADAVRAEGLDMGFYYSIIDWNHPDYRYELKTPEDGKAYRRYLDYMKAQLKELLTEYGDIKVLWFDGRWDPSYKKNPQYGKEIEAYVRSLKPGIVINDRVRAYDGIADYNSGFERRLPEGKLPETDWEACMTIPKLTWGYHREPGALKSPREICEMLSRCASMNGNFLLNIGPRPDGTIRPEEVERLTAVGDWLRVNGEAVYSAHGAAMPNLPKGVYATRRGNRTYLHVYDWPKGGRLTLPAALGKPTRAFLLSAPASPLALTSASGGMTVGLPTLSPDTIASVLVLEEGGGIAALDTLLAYRPISGKPVADPAVLAARDALCEAVKSPATLEAGVRVRLDTLLRERGNGLAVTRKTPVSQDDPLAWVLVNYQSAVFQQLPPEQVTAYPGAADFPGLVAEGAKPVRKTVTIDGNTDPAARRSTGLYAAPGAVVTVRTDASVAGKGLKVRIGAHSDSLRNRFHRKYTRLPEISRTFAIDGPVTRAACSHGGLVYIDIPDNARLGKITFTIEGAVESSTYVLGETTPAQWEVERRHPAPWGEIITPTVILTVPSDAFRAVDNPKKAAEFWDRVVREAARFTGRPEGQLSFARGGPSRTERFVPDIDISVGAMHAGYPIMTMLTAVPDELDPEVFLKGREGSKRWGLLHELGHNYQTQRTADGGRYQDWTFDNGGEITNNVVALYLFDWLGLDWKTANPGLVDSRKRAGEMLAAGKKPWLEKDEHFLRLCLYVQLREGVGWKPFEQIYRDFYTLPADQRPKDDAEKRDQWVRRVSKASGRNLVPFFERWGLEISDAVRREVADLPPWIPEDFAGVAPGVKEARR